MIVAFHRPEPLRLLVSMLRHPDIEIILVNVEDDAAVSALAGPDVAVTPTRSNCGYAAAVNLGVRKASSDITVFCNDDVALDGPAVLALAEVIRAGDADVAVPRLTRPDGQTERSIAALPTLAALVREWLLLPDAPVALLADRLRVEKWRLPERPTAVRAAAATVVAARTELLRSEPLPEAYFLYWEEMEWFWTLCRQGRRVQYRPEITAGHGGGRFDVRPEKSVLMARNAVRCIRRTQGRLSALAALPVVVLWNLRLLTIAALRTLAQPASARDVLRARVAGVGAAVGAWREVW